MANSSIKNIGNENTIARRETIAQIRAASESNGVEFSSGSGVKLKSGAVTIVQGKEATPTLFNGLCTTAHASADREILILGLDGQLAAQHDGRARLKDHNARLKKADIKQ